MAKKKKAKRDAGSAKRVRDAKAKVTKLVDKGVAFNPKSASGHLLERAVDNLTKAGLSSSGASASVQARASGSVSAARPKKKKKKK